MATCGPMRSIAWACCKVCLAVLLTGCNSQPATLSANRVRTSDPSVSQIVAAPFIYNSDNPYLTVSVPFENVTNERVTFVRTQSNCCCTDVTTDRMEAAPGETIKATAVFNLRGRAPGPQRFTVALVMGNGQSWGRDILVEIVKLAHWNKEQIYLGSISRGRSSTARTTFQACRAKRDEIDPRMAFTTKNAAVSAENTGCKIHFRKDINLWVAIYEVMLGVRDGEGVENVATSVSPGENFPDGPHELFVAWNYRPAIEIAPSTLFLMPSAKNDPVRVTLTAADASLFTIREVICDPPGQIVANFVRGAAIQHVIELTLRETPKNIASNGRLTFKTSHSNAPSIVATFAVFVPEAPR